MEALERVQPSHSSARQELSVSTGSVNVPMVLVVHNVTVLSAQGIVEQRKAEAFATWCVTFLLQPVVLLKSIRKQLKCILGMSHSSHFTCLLILLQTLGLCVCTEGWAGSDCASISDSDSLVWETLLDTQLSAVSLPLSFRTIEKIVLCSYKLKQIAVSFLPTE